MSGRGGMYLRWRVEQKKTASSDKILISVEEYHALLRVVEAAKKELLDYQDELFHALAALEDK